MHLHILTTLLLTSTALSLDIRPRQTTTAPDSFSSNAAQLISLYIPESVQSAIASAASLTGDAQSIIQSALVATTTPPWFTAIPSQYSSNVAALESAISDLRGAAQTGIPGAPVVTTGTDSAGSTFTSIIPGSAASSLGSAVSSLESGASSALSSVLASASSVASSLASSAESAASSARSSASAAASSLAASSSSSSAWAVPTRVPMAAAGVLGFVGAILAM